MGLNFKDILSEDTSPRNAKFVNMILPKMKDHFVNANTGEHWVESARWMENHDVSAYRGSLERSKVIANEMLGYIEKLRYPEKYTPKQLYEISNFYHEKQQEYTQNMGKVNHIQTLFSYWSSTGSFVDTYAIPIGVLLDVWGRFYEEIYKPAKIEHNRELDGLGLEYGLPDGNYSDIGTFSNQRYQVMKDNQSNEFILIVNINGIDWNKEDMNYDELYYKRYKTKQEVKSIMVGGEFKSLKIDLYGAELEYSVQEVQQAYDYLEHNDVRLQELADEDYEGDFEQALSEKLVYPEGIVDERRNQYGGSDALSLSRYLLRTYLEIKSFNF